MMHNNSQLWNASMDLVEDIYSFLKLLPDEERYGLISQMQRCAVSIPSNIAEGSARGYTKEYIRFLRISQSSLKELETQYLLCLRLFSLSTNQQIETKLEQVSKQLSGLINYLKSKPA